MDRNLGWYYWAATVPLLIVGVFFAAWGIYAAILLTGVQALHFYSREKTAGAFPIQVRLAYLALLALGLWGPLFFIHWIQLAGTISVVTVGYCPLARIMSLMPWNRTAPASWAMVRETFLTPPVKGSIQAHFTGQAAEKPLE